MMTIDIGAYDAPYMSTVWKGDEIVGEITSGAMGYRSNKFVALSVVRTDCLAAGNRPGGRNLWRAPRGDGHR